MQFAELDKITQQLIFYDITYIVLLLQDTTWSYDHNIKKGHETYRSCR